MMGREKESSDLLLVLWPSASASVLRLHSSPSPLPPPRLIMHDISGSFRSSRFQIPVELTHLHPLALSELRLAIRQLSDLSVTLLPTLCHPPLDEGFTLFKSSSFLFSRCFTRHWA
ncbi:hypothetical protein BJX76DRAFT_338844, partial [Aspergillus varians]